MKSVLTPVLPVSKSSDRYRAITQGLGVHVQLHVAAAAADA